MYMDEPYVHINVHLHDIDAFQLISYCFHPHNIGPFLTNHLRFVPKAIQQTLHTYSSPIAFQQPS